MTTRRDILKIGMASAAFVGTPKLDAKLVFPDGFIPSIVDRPSPPARPFVAPLNVMPISKAVSENRFYPPPNPARHQRYNEFLPQEFHLHRIQEFLWRYHPEPPYDKGSWSWGFNGITPGPTFKAHYGKPLFLRRTNELPPLGRGNVKFALPSVTIHLHNAHTASESDGIPQDFFWPGEFWDHHYANFPAGFDEREIMSTLWYHDHRLDFTAPNVYAGLTGFYLLFDELDSDNERDENPKALRLPSGDYDVPLMLHDVQFDQNGQVVWDFFNPVTQAPDVFGALTTSNGMDGRSRMAIASEPEKM